VRPLLLGGCGDESEDRALSVDRAGDALPRARCRSG
jgi:hypothetical protein